MNTRINELTKFINTNKGQKEYIKDSLEKAQKAYADTEKELKAAKAALEEIQEAARKTQQGIEVHFGKVVTAALHSSGFTKYKFKPVFEKRRNKTECDMLLEKNGNAFKPESFVGGGILDICAFALRIALWKLEGTAPVLGFDEPFKMIGKGTIPELSSMLKEIQSEFGMQMIIMTHHDELECGDKKFYVENGEIT
jgi:hypothetical protein